MDGGDKDRESDKKEGVMRLREAWEKEYGEAGYELWKCYKMGIIDDMSEEEAVSYLFGAFMHGHIVDWHELEEAISHCNRDDILKKYRERFDKIYSIWSSS